MAWTIEFDQVYDKARTHGLDISGNPTIEDYSIKKGYVVIRTEGCSVWNGVARPWRYEPASLHVYLGKFVKPTSRFVFEIDSPLPLVKIPVRRDR